MSGRKTKGRKQYRSPRVETREIYEVNALGCAKCPTTSSISIQPACIRGTKKFS
jgi:hypothetical protein